MIKYCIFDLDGTLLDTLDTITHYVNKTLRAEGIPEVTRDDCRRFVGDGARHLIERSMRAGGVEDSGRVKPVLEKYKRTYDEDPNHLTRVYPGISEALLRLRECGVRLAVLSNKPASSVRLVVNHFFGDIFDEVLGARYGVPLKPNPHSLLELMERMGAAADNTAFIGDTDVDILTAKNAGVALALGVAWGFRDSAVLQTAGADVVVESSEEMLRALGVAE